jgi:hypothetical protein
MMMMMMKENGYDINFQSVQTKSSYESCAYSFSNFTLPIDEILTYISFVINLSIYENDIFISVVSFVVYAYVSNGK